MRPAKTPETPTSGRLRRLISHLLDERGWVPEDRAESDRDTLEALVRAKRLAGLSWQDIRDSIRDHTGESVSVKWLTYQFPHLNKPAHTTSTT